MKTAIKQKEFERKRKRNEYSGVAILKNKKAEEWEFFESIEELLNETEEIPQLVHPTIPRTYELTVEDVLDNYVESAVNNLGIDYPDVYGQEELEKFLKKWNKKYAITYNEVVTGIKILIDNKEQEKKYKPKKQN